MLLPLEARTAGTHLTHTIWLEPDVATFWYFLPMPKHSSTIQLYATHSLKCQLWFSPSSFSIKGSLENICYLKRRLVEPWNAHFAATYCYLVPPTRPEISLRCKTFADEKESSASTQNETTEASTKNLQSPCHPDAVCSPANQLHVDKEWKDLKTTCMEKQLRWPGSFLKFQQLSVKTWADCPARNMSTNQPRDNDPTLAHFGLT